jgi:hypothetical protein
MRWQQLKGKKIEGFTHTQEAITFSTADGPLKFVATGECCSQSWIDAVNELGAFPGTVLEAAEVDGPEGDDAPQPAVAQEFTEYLRVYFYKIKTDRGYLDLTMYNDSNGYYGGELECSEYPTVYADD